MALTTATNPVPPEDGPFAANIPWLINHFVVFLLYMYLLGSIALEVISIKRTKQYLILIK